MDYSKAAETLPVYEADEVMLAPFVARDYHGGQASALYALASTGTLTSGLAREATEAARAAEGQGFYAEAETLTVLGRVAERLGF